MCCKQGSLCNDSPRSSRRTKARKRRSFRQLFQGYKDCKYKMNCGEDLQGSHLDGLDQSCHYPLPLKLEMDSDHGNLISKRDIATCTTPMSVPKNMMNQRIWRKFVNFSACTLLFLLGPILITANVDSKIGDLVRSKRSSFLFFNGVDQNGDGELKRSEMESFVRDSIGGSAFDTDREVANEVNRLMNTLDFNHDDKLDYGDVFMRWTQLENLLTVNEVKDWIRYALQLPEDIVHVTGHDFPELIENNGEALEKDLGIEKQKIRKTLLRGLRVKLLGIGSSPTKPLRLSYTIDTCSAVTLDWRKPAAISFPVHGYRVQRKTIVKRTMTNFSDVSHINVDTSIQKPSNEIESVSVSSDWTTVYFGAEPHYFDSNVTENSKIVYRVQAWNLVGHSEWLTVDITTSLKQRKCIHHDENDPPLFFEEPIYFFTYYSSRTVSFLLFNWFTSMLTHTFQTICSVLALVTGLIRYRRATAASSAFPNTKPLFPWFWKVINDISIWAFGTEIVPKNFTEVGYTSLLSDDEHDRRIRATNVAGYKKSFHESKPSFAKQVTIMRRNTRQTLSTEGSTKRDVKLKRSHSAPHIPKPNREEVSKKFVLKKLFNRNRNHKCLEVGYEIPKTINTRPSVDVCSIAQSEISFESKSDREDESVDMNPRSSHGTEKSIDRFQDEWRDDHCSICKKRFKFGKRWKHNCAQCLSPFCQKDGFTTHSAFLSCKVPGDCVCNRCLGK